MNAELENLYGIVLPPTFSYATHLAGVGSGIGYVFYRRNKLQHESLQSPRAGSSAQGTLADDPESPQPRASKVKSQLASKVSPTGGPSMYS